MRNRDVIHWMETEEQGEEGGMTMSRGNAQKGRDSLKDTHWDLESYGSSRQIHIVTLLITNR